MSSSTTSPLPQQAPLRLWPGVALVSLQWLLRFVLPFFVISAMPTAMLSGALLGLLVLLWWTCFSRAPRGQRWGVLLACVLAILLSSLLVHESLAEAMRGIMLLIYLLPTLSLGLVVWARFGSGLPSARRRLSLVLMLLISCGMWMSVRTSGVTGSAGAQFSWRWAPSPEEQLLAQGEEALRGPVASEVAVQAHEDTGEQAAEWPGFRGRDRDGVLRDAGQLRFARDWAGAPLEKLWSRPVGPGWSSFAVAGELLYTQEQRGEEELVSCYSVVTGEPVWRHKDPVRFWEALAGAGPRGTPSLGAGRLFALGATGLLNVLDALDGSLIWSRDVASETERAIPEWGFSSSPLLFEELVIVAVSGQLVAYQASDGVERWTLESEAGSYASPQLLSINGTPQVVLMTTEGASSVAPRTGELLWEHEWRGDPIVQPALTEDGGLLISAGDTSGLRRLALKQDAGGWSTELDWRSIRLKPWFNDFVLHGGHAYGFDGSVLACIDVQSGKRAWKGGRYGNGQLILLEQAELLVVLSEEGELILVEAKPEAFNELARSPAIQGKTWNHPALIRDVLLVRNDQEMAAFRLPLVEN